MAWNAYDCVLSRYLAITLTEIFALLTACNMIEGVLKSNDPKPPSDRNFNSICMREILCFIILGHVLLCAGHTRISRGLVRCLDGSGNHFAVKFRFNNSAPSHNFHFVASNLLITTGNQTM